MAWAACARSWSRIWRTTSFALSACREQANRAHLTGLWRSTNATPLAPRRHQSTSTNNNVNVAYQEHPSFGRNLSTSTENKKKRVHKQVRARGGTHNERQVSVPLLCEGYAPRFEYGLSATEDCWEAFFFVVEPLAMGVAGAPLVGRAYSKGSVPLRRPLTHGPWWYQDHSTTRDDHSTLYRRRPPFCVGQ
jgi:hypothetical protein